MSSYELHLKTNINIHVNALNYITPLVENVR
jgi:hypothetical protein